MCWNRIMDAGLDPLIAKVAAQRVAPLAEHRKDVVVLRAVLGLGQELNSRDGLPISRSHRCPGLIPFRHSLEFHSQRSTLDSFHPVVVAKQLVRVLLRRSMIAQGADPLGNSKTVSDDCAPLPDGPQVLGGVEAEAGDIAKAAGGTGLICRSEEHTAELQY